jgi:hypothetical protein
MPQPPALATVAELSRSAIDPMKPMQLGHSQRAWLVRSIGARLRVHGAVRGVNAWGAATASAPDTGAETKTTPGCRSTRTPGGTSAPVGSGCAITGAGSWETGLGFMANGSC